MKYAVGCRKVELSNSAAASLKNAETLDFGTSAGIKNGSDYADGGWNRGNLPTTRSTENTMGIKPGNSSVSTGGKAIPDNVPSHSWDIYDTKSTDAYRYNILAKASGDEYAAPFVPRKSVAGNPGSGISSVTPSGSTIRPIDLPKVDGKGGIVTLKHQATSGVELVSTPGKTTTILGRYGSDTGAIIEELGIPKNTDFSGNLGGFNLLNTPDEYYVTADQFWDEYNKPFLDAVIERGDEILMATPINTSTLYMISGDLTGYGREYYYLLSKGYEYIDGKMVLKGS